MSASYGQFCHAHDTAVHPRRLRIGETREVAAAPIHPVRQGSLLRSPMRTETAEYGVGRHSSASVCNGGSLERAVPLEQLLSTPVLYYCAMIGAHGRIERRYQALGTHLRLGDASTGG